MTFLVWRSNSVWLKNDTNKTIHTANWNQKLCINHMNTQLWISQISIRGQQTFGNQQLVYSVCNDLIYSIYFEIFSGFESQTENY